MGKSIQYLWKSYTAKNQKLLKTGCNNVVGATLFNVVNNIVRHCYTWLQANSGSTILFNIVDNQEQCCPNNIVASYFQQPVTTHNFLPCTCNKHVWQQHIDVIVSGSSLDQQGEGYIRVELWTASIFLLISPNWELRQIPFSTLEEFRGVALTIRMVWLDVQLETVIGPRTKLDLTFLENEE